MTSVTADSNIYISGLEFGGLPERFLQLARNGVFRLDISESIKREVLRVLRKKFKYPTQATIECHRSRPLQQSNIGMRCSREE